jgi:HSP20 family protein
MSTATVQAIPVQKVIGVEKDSSPIFAEINKRLDEVRRRAYDLFQLRGSSSGLELDDWLAAEREVFGWAKVELTEKDNAYDVQVALPGFEAKDVEVTATPEEIVIHAASEHREREETTSSEIYRRFELPKPVQLDKVVAKLDKGVLLISVPCASQAKPVTSEKQVKVVAA